MQGNPKSIAASNNGIESSLTRDQLKSHALEGRNEGRTTIVDLLLMQSSVYRKTHMQN